MANRNDPLRLLLLNSAGTGKPRNVGDVDAALDQYAAGLPDVLSSSDRAALRDELLKASRTIAELRGEGSNGAARDKANMIAEKITAAHGEWSETSTPANTDGMSPRDLAALIPRGGA